MNKLLLTIVLFLPGCALFQSPNPTPALLAVEELSMEFEDTLINFKAMVQGLEIDAGKKAELLALLDNKDKKRMEIVEGLQEWLKSIGDLDWVEWGNAFYERFQKLREKIKEGS